MAAQAYAIIATASITYVNGQGATVQAPAGTVINRVMWDGGSDWTPPANTEARADPNGTLGIGSTTSV